MSRAAPAPSPTTAVEPLRSVAALRARVAAWRREGARVALVPTMGGLHEGHAALVRAARGHADRVVASIFVNPAQFGPTEDFAAYPRDEAGDLVLLAGAGAQAAYLPPPEAMYPPGHATTVAVAGVAEPLEGEHRPGHFAGVATVVAKLLIQAGADAALFGEKDYQQLLVVRALARDLDLPTAIVGVPTVREADGLALSSRNRYLAPDERAAAPALHRALLALAAAARAGEDPAVAEARARAALEAAGFGPVAYLALRDAATLGPWRGPGAPGRALGAAFLGRTRLIDNVAA